MKYLTLFLFSFFSFFSYSQNPGGVANKIQFWVKADNGVNGGSVPVLIPGTMVSQWNNSASPITMTLEAQKTPTGSVTSGDNLINYNSTVSFDGSNNEVLDGVFSTLPPTGERSSAHLFSVMIVRNGNGVGDQPYSSKQFGEHVTGDASVGIVTHNGSNFTVDASGSVGNSQVVPQLFTPNIVDVNYIINGDLNLGETSLNGSLPVVSTNFCPVQDMGGYFEIGGRTYGGYPQRVFNGDIGEVIHYSGSDTYGHSVLQYNKVMTYLAIKYGITLSNVGGVQGDYISTNGSVIWDASVSPSYHNDVIGIGRDDTEDLLQKQSHTFDDITRIYVDNLTAHNSVNSGMVGNDISYVTVGHNTGAMCATVPSIAEIPTGIANCNLYSRLEREWKVTKTNFSQVFNSDFSLDICALPNSVNVSDLRLLVDDDGDFSNGGTTCYYNGDGTGIILSYSNSAITVSNIGNSHIANNSTMYITLASVASSTPLPIELIAFQATAIENRKVNLTWQTASEIANDFFVIDRSVDLENWELLVNIDGAGNSIAELSYSTDDFDPYSGVTYYRLSQVDFDGELTFGGIRSVVIDASEEIGLFIYPNPTSGKLKIIGDQHLLKEIQLFNSVGEEVVMHVITTGDSTVTIDLSNLALGLYLLKSGDEVYKIVRNK